MVAQRWKASLELAAEALADEKRRLASKGFDAQDCAVVQGRTTELPELEKILASHPRLHTAEGVLFRQVLMLAAEACGMRVHGVPEHGMEERAAKALGLPAGSLMPRLSELGRGLGSPWTLDQKYAAAAAWLTLL